MSQSQDITLMNVHSERLYKSLEDIITNNDLSLGNITDIVVSLMIIVDRYPELKGSEKKRLILQVLEKYVMEHIPTDTGTQKDLVFFIRMVLPSTIDVIIQVDKRETIVKEILKKRSFVGCMVCTSKLVAWVVNTIQKRKKSKN